MKFRARQLVALVIVLSMVAVGVVIFVWSGIYNIAADEPHTKLVAYLMQRVRERSVDVRARDIKVPELRDQKMIASGAKNYAEMCMGCHLAPGTSRSELRAGLNPQPPNLSEPSGRDPREAFWVIKHGIRMSAMPAWGKSHDDEAIWALVAFISSMPTMSVAQYQSLGGPAAKMTGMHGDSMQGKPMADDHHGSPQAADQHEMKGMRANTAKGKPMSSAKPRGSMEGMDHSQMKGMPAEATKGKPVPTEKPQGSMQGMDHSQMKGMQPDATKGKPVSTDKPQDAMQGMDHSQMKGMQPDATKGKPVSGAKPHGSMAMDMGPMQGGKAPPDARDPDAYANGMRHGPMRGMDMADNAPFLFLRLDKLEHAAARGRSSQRLDGEAWFGGDTNKLWVKVEGERSGGRTGARTEALWNRTIATFWATELGIRHDFGQGPGRNWAAFGVQGLAPYWFDVEATAYVGESGRTAARAELRYELLVTQRLIFQPNLELNWYGKNDPARGIGAGLSDLEAGLRLRYEVTRQFAPYIGVEWNRKLGKTADFARAAGEKVQDTQFVTGLRLWF